MIKQQENSIVCSIGGRSQRQLSNDSHRELIRWEHLAKPQKQKTMISSSTKTRVIKGAVMPFPNHHVDGELEMRGGESPDQETSELSIFQKGERYLKLDILS